MESEQFIISLLQLPKVGRKTAWKILHTQKDIARSAVELLETVTNTSGAPSVTRQDAENAWTDAKALIDRVSSANMQVLSCMNEDFPARLRSIPDPPLILFVKGDANCIRTPLGVAVIGTREPTEYGKKIAHRFGQRGAEAGCVIISGLATGCDYEAHRGCLDAAGRTVAVLAHGLDRIYPKDNEQLAGEILDRGGCLVSEYAPGTRPQRSYFVERDRLQSGLASGVIVVETDTEGGTMHTVRFAEEQGRPVAALSHPSEYATCAKSRGNKLLIDEKRAKPLKEAGDLMIFIDAVRQVASRWANEVTKSESKLEAKSETQTAFW